MMNIDFKAIVKPHQGLSERHLYISRMAVLLIVEHGWDAEKATKTAVQSADIVFGLK